MAKRIQLVLTQNVSKLGRIGDLVEVAPGYARNYLVPQGKATTVNPGILKQVARRRELEEQRLAELRQQAVQIAAEIETAGGVDIEKQAGENDAIFGTVTNQDVAEAIKAKTNQEVDRRTITLPDIHKIGEYKAQVKLHPEVTATVVVRVVAA
ncbi:50S ribosomal protein L9 [Leptolyngbya sp. FACHB-17]|uniref:50S ribosomal protein L9 n=1 Tax=unclassified Leptolyngbya TaxID=2650499 RepID=UPI0016816C07|nr:50S ribosomal protein L9 [Leptolyngbya sp. FACHB-17]MBD2079365.1 50S ribosomal protein L9 [Leptolyngbya sp. FACHB-17]